MKTPALPAAALYQIAEEDSLLEPQQASAAAAQPLLPALDSSKRLKSGLVKTGSSLALPALDHAVIGKGALATKAASDGAPAAQARSMMQTDSTDRAQALAKSGYQGKEGKSLPGPSRLQPQADSRAASSSVKASPLKSGQSQSQSGKKAGGSAVAPLPGKKLVSSADSGPRQAASEARTAKGLPALPLRKKAHVNVNSSQAKLTTAASLEQPLLKAGSQDASTAEVPRHKMVGLLPTSPA